MLSPVSLVETVETICINYCNQADMSHSCSSGYLSEELKSSCLSVINAGKNKIEHLDVLAGKCG